MTSSNSSVPGLLRGGIYVVLMQSVCAIFFAIYLIVKDLRSDISEEVVSEAATAQWIGTGTAIFIMVIFGFMGVAAWNILLGRLWGRGLIILVQCILLPVAWSMISGGMVTLGVATALSAIIALIGVLHPQSMGYAASHYQR